MRRCVPWLICLTVAAVCVTSRALTAGGQSQAAATGAQAEPARTIEEFAGPDALTYRSAGVTQPRVLVSPSPKYTPVAMRAKAEGIVELFALVGLDGKVERSQVAQSLHPDLDAEALRTLRQWQFEPARLNGKPVRIAVTITMEFRIHR